MRSIKKLYGSINKYDMVIGCYYRVLINDPINSMVDEWIFRFTGLSGRSNNILSDITYVNDGGSFIHCGDYNGELCYDSEIIKGSLRKYSERKLNEKLNPL